MNQIYLHYLSTFVYIKIVKCLLCVGGLSSHSRIFHWFGDVTITDVSLRGLTYTWHLWPLSSEGSLAFTSTMTGTAVYKCHLQRPLTICLAFGRAFIFFKTSAVNCLFESNSLFQYQKIFFSLNFST